MTGKSHGSGRSSTLIALGNMGSGLNDNEVEYSEASSSAEANKLDLMSSVSDSFGKIGYSKMV